MDKQHHEHTHGVIDPTILSTNRGIWAVKWSFIGLMIPAIFQAMIYYFSGSVALLGDVIHNLGDAFTALPLWIAFLFAAKKPTKRFTYGFGRVEDLAGIIVVVIIFLSAVAVGYQSIDRFIHPRKIEYLGAVALASLIGFIGNEAVALFRIKIGNEINSAALIADGYHARVDGFVSLGVLLSVIGVWLGYPMADPIIGLIMTVAILKIVWEASKMIFTRLLDGVEPEWVDKIKDGVKCNEIILGVAHIKVRWIGHHLNAELTVLVNSDVPMEKIIRETEKVKSDLTHRFPPLSHITVSFLTSESMELQPIPTSWR